MCVNRSEPFFQILQHLIIMSAKELARRWPSSTNLIPLHCWCCPALLPTIQTFMCARVRAPSLPLFNPQPPRFRNSLTPNLFHSFSDLLYNTYSRTHAHTRACTYNVKSTFFFLGKGYSLLPTTITHSSVPFAAFSLSNSSLLPPSSYIRFYH